MAWVTVETNQRKVVLCINTAVKALLVLLGMDGLEKVVMEAVRVAERIEEPLESLEDDS